MPEFLNRHRRKVAVALAFDDRTEALLDAGVQLARALSAPLRLVHVLDPMAPLTRSVLTTGMEAGPFALASALREESRGVAEARLARLARTLPGDIPSVETAVLEGEPARSLAQDAEAHRVGLILAGSGRTAVSGLGLSTVVSIIIEADVPVLVLSDAMRFAPTEAQATVVIADDFCDEAGSALAAGFALAAAWPKARVIHAHVETFSHLGEGLRDMDTDGLVERLRERRAATEDAMRMRAGEFAQTLVDAGGSYEQEITSGAAVAAEIERTAASARADVVVFGQHRVVHRHPAHSGQVPFKLMLALPRPVLIVPLSDASK